MPNDTDENVTPNSRIMRELESCVKCCKHCRTETNIDRLMQIEPAEAPLQPALLIESAKNLLKR